MRRADRSRLLQVLSESTQPALASWLGTSERTVRRWLKGTSEPDRAQLAEIARLAGYLERGIYNPPPVPARSNLHKIVAASTQSRIGDWLGTDRHQIARWLRGEGRPTSSQAVEINRLAGYLETGVVGPPPGPLEPFVAPRKPLKSRRIELTGAPATPRELSRYEKIPGDSSGRYLDTVTGETISRRRYETIKRGMSNEQYSRARRMEGIKRTNAEYTTLSERFRIHKAKELGVSEQEIRMRGRASFAAEFRELFRELKRLHVEKGDVNKERNRILAQMGLIPAESVSYYVSQKSR